MLAIYSQNEEPESSFLANVQSILQALHELETNTPGEYLMDFRDSGLIVAGRLFGEALPLTARTSSSLYLSIYLVSVLPVDSPLFAHTIQAIIYTVRPVLLHMAKGSRDGCAMEGASPVQKQLAGICVEAARKSLVILEQLMKHSLIGKPERPRPTRSLPLT